jgi:hypothetical protein
MPGPVVLLGCPGSGKSRLALELALQEVNRTGYPLLIIDPARAWNFQSYHHAETPDEVVTWLWGKRKHVAYTPMDPERDFEPLMRAARAGRQVILLIDELKFVLPSSRSMSLQFQLAVRLWRHADLPAIYATTQCYLDAARPLRAAVSRWMIFRCVDPGDLAHLAKDFRLDPARVEQLGPGEYLEVQRGFA